MFRIDNEHIYLIKNTLNDWLEENSNSDVNPRYYKRVNEMYKNVKRKWEKLGDDERERIKQKWETKEG